MSTPEQTFTRLYNLANDPAAPDPVRESAKDKMAAWLKRHAKTERDYPTIFAKAAEDDKAQQPPPPPSDPRDGAPHPFDDPRFTPAGLVEGIAAKYVAMPEQVRVIYALGICFTHVFERFAIAPRIAFVSDDPGTGKSTAIEVARHLVRRPNPESFATGASINEFLDEGLGTVVLDELDLVDPDTRRMLQLIWNLGHRRGAKRSLVVRGKRKLVNLHAPMMAAGIGSFLKTTQTTRTFNLEMHSYTEETKPERDYWTEEDFSDLNVVYSYLHHWAPTAKLNPKPALPPGVIARFADNVRGLLSVADSCGPEWGRRAREAVTWLFEKEKAERPDVLILRHVLIIFDTLEQDPIPSRVVNRELSRLDLPEARWNRYLGPGGGEYAHLLTLDEQAKLLRPSGIVSKLLRPSGGGKPFRGYRREWFVEALRKRNATAPAARLRLVAPEPD